MEPKTFLLKGKIGHLTVVDTAADLIFTEGDRNAAAFSGVAAATLGMSGLAANAVTSSVEESKEPMKRATFELGGHSIEALLWDFPFAEGDKVEAVVEMEGGTYRAYAIARPEDRVIAVYPYSTSGRVAHFRNSFIAYLKFCLFVLFPVFCLMGLAFVWADVSFQLILKGGGSGALLTTLLFLVIGLNISRKFLPFVYIAERIFTALGFENVRRINLRRLTKKLRRPDDPPALGDTYFRY